MTDPNAGFGSFAEFFAQHEGSMMCACDHGCNQFIKRQEPRLAVAVRMMRLGRTRNLDKLASLPLPRVVRIWRWLFWNDNRRFNAALRSLEVAEAEKALADKGISEKDFSIAVLRNNGDSAAIAGELGLTRGTVIVLKQRGT